MKCYPHTDETIFIEKYFSYIKPYNTLLFTLTIKYTYIIFLNKRENAKRRLLALK